MKNLGKIFLLLSLTSLGLFASVQASLDSNEVYSGEMVTYSLSMRANAIVKPNITQICGNNVVSTSSQTSIESINGSYSKIYTLSYQFMPEKSCIIEPAEVNIDSIIEKSNSIKLTVKEPSQEIDAPFVLTCKPSKTELYVGEPFELEFTLTQKLSAQALESKFIAPDFKGFWLKSQSEPARVENSEGVITTVIYTLAPQREGNISILPAQLQIATRVSTLNGWGGFSPQVKWRSYYSNKSDFLIKPLPNAATIIGDFTLKAEISKREINSNEALNLSVIVEGIGNLEDIKSFKPYIEHVSIFDEEIVVDGNKLTQKLAFVADNNFTIPAFELVFFNTNTQKLQKIKSEAIDVKVNAKKEQKELSIQRQKAEEKPYVREEKSEIALTWIALAFVAGLGVGVLVMLLRFPLKRRREAKFDIKDEKLLLIKLLPYKEKIDVQEIVKILENNLYANKKEKIDKKLLKEVLKRYDIS